MPDEPRHQRDETGEVVTAEASTRASSQDPFEALRARLALLADLQQIHHLLSWDQQTYMPPAAAASRGQQLASLGLVLRERWVDPELAAALARCEQAGYDDDSVEVATVRRARRLLERARKLPADFIEERAKVTARAQQVWIQARRESDFARFAPELERLLELARRAAELLGYDEHPYDALHDLYEPGSTTARLKQVFTPLKAALLKLLGEIEGAEIDPDDAPLHQHFPEARQEQFALEVVRGFGYDLSRGRLDRTVHPFAQGMGKYDVRITTRYHPDNLATALFGVMHEAGHAMYEQGFDDAFERTPLGDVASLGVHESQSRLWENLVGRSYPFWRGAYPRLQELFPEQLGDVSLEQFYAAINRVTPSPIRVEADEVTYNLHVLVRFELELELLEGKLPVAALPEAWNAKYQETLGITPENDRVGVLQDIHWAVGMFGYFPTYTLGNLMSAQLYEAAAQALPELDREIRRGEFGGLLGWLRENVHRHGARYLPEELLERATGSPLDAEPYVRYLRRKYRALYGLERDAAS